MPHSCWKPAGSGAAESHQELSGYVMSSFLLPAELLIYIQISLGLYVCMFEIAKPTIMCWQSQTARAGNWECSGSEVIIPFLDSWTHIPCWSQAFLPPVGTPRVDHSESSGCHGKTVKLIKGRVSTEWKLQLWELVYIHVLDVLLLEHKHLKY